MVTVTSRMTRRPCVQDRTGYEFFITPSFCLINFFLEINIGYAWVDLYFCFAGKYIIYRCIISSISCLEKGDVLHVYVGYPWKGRHCTITLLHRPTILRCSSRWFKDFAMLWRRLLGLRLMEVKPAGQTFIYSIYLYPLYRIILQPHSVNI